MNRTWLAPLARLYAAGLAVKNSGYERGWLETRRLQRFVVSIGNLSVGGSGKTPLTIRLAELLAAEGFAADVLSRGYGRRSTATERVDPAGSADRYGDEPLLIARRADVPVYVGGSRWEAGLLAESQRKSAAQSSVHLLDDGFQHRQLARDVDIVVLHRSDFSETLLPAGRLREPLQALRRADFAVLREEDAEFESQLRRLNIEAPIWWMRRAVALRQPAGSPPPKETKGGRMLAFCGVARPREFFQSLAGMGVSLTRTIEFPDHHSYTLADAEQLANLCSGSQADALVTTEKDEVKLDAALLQALQKTAPLFVARLDVSLHDEAATIRQLRARLLQT